MANEELWQGYTLNGEPGKAITKTEARGGALHGASHVWVWRRHDNQIEILVQRRAKDKLTWPGYLDISAAGHIDAGETPISAAVREAREEISLSIDSDKLQLLFVRYVDDDAGSGVREREFVWVYLYAMPELSEGLRLEDGEVDSIQWLALDELRKLSRDELPGQKVVPHIYFADLLAELQKLKARA